MIVKYKFEVERRHRGRKVITESEPRAPRPKRPQASSKARRLALAYFIERAIDSGLLKDYADAARRLGVSRARVTQIVDLIVMTVPEQEGLLRRGVEAC